MSDINLFDKFTWEFLNILKDLGIEYVSNVQVMNEGTLLSFNAFPNAEISQKYTTFLIHDQLATMYFELNGMKLCSSDSKEEIYKRTCLKVQYINIYVEYDGVANFKVINHYSQRDLNHITRIVFLHNGAREDLLYSFFSLIFEYSIAVNALDVLFGKNMIKTEKFVNTLKMMASSDYRYIKDLNLLYINSIFDRKKMLSTKKPMHPLVLMKVRNNPAIKDLIVQRNKIKNDVFLKRIEFEFRKKKIDYNKSMICTNSLNSKNLINITNRFPYLNKLRRSLYNSKDDFMKLRCVYGEHRDIFRATLENYKLTFEDSDRESMLCSNKYMEEKMIRKLIEDSDNKDLSLCKKTNSSTYLDKTNQEIPCANKFSKRETRLFGILKGMSLDEQVFIIKLIKRLKKVSHSERDNMSIIFRIIGKLLKKERPRLVDLTDNYINYKRDDIEYNKNRSLTDHPYRGYARNFAYALPDGENTSIEPYRGYARNFSYDLSDGENTSIEPYRGYARNFSYDLSDGENTSIEPSVDFSLKGGFSNDESKMRYRREIGYSSSASNLSKDINLEIMIGFIISLFLLRFLYKACCKFFSIRKNNSDFISYSVNSVNKVINSCDRY